MIHLFIIITGIYYLVFSILLPLKKTFKILYFILGIVLIIMSFIEQTELFKIVELVLMLFPLILYALFKNKIRKKNIEKSSS